MSQNKKTVLFIEDDFNQRKMYQTVFTKAGYRFLLADDGRQGLKRVLKYHPDLVLLDILMPEMDGIEFLKLIKNKPKVADIPILVLTNFTREETLKHALTLGAQEVIIKTNIVPKELLKKVEKKYFK